MALTKMVDLNALYPLPLPFPPKRFVSPLGGAKGFSLTPNISATLRNFSKIFSLPDTPPQALQNPLPFLPNSLPVWGEGPPKKNFLTPIFKKIPAIKCPKIFHSDPGGGPLEISQLKIICFSMRF